MGQRHQIYVVLPYEIELKKNWETEENVLTNIVPLHHRWLYGVMAGKQLLQLLTYHKNGIENGDYFILSNDGKINSEYAPNLLKFLYSVNIEEGYYHGVSLEDYQLSDNPKYGDNNDGITIIDLRNNIPKYCFMFIGAGGYYSKHYTPINALEYMSNYYGDKVIQSSSYWQENKETFYKMQEEMIIVWNKVNDFTLLSLDEVKELFPKMFETSKEE